MDELLKDLTLEMIPEGLYKQIAEEIGVSNFYKLAEVVGGATVNGYNHPQLAKKYGVTERWVRQLCGEGCAEGQISIFDYVGPENRQS